MATVTLRPSAVVRVNGVTTTGGTVAAVTSDNNLGTWAIGTTPNGTVWLDIGTSTLGALRVKSAQLRIQNAHDSAGGTVQTAWARFYDPADATVTGHTPMTRGTTTVDQQRGPAVLSGAPGGKVWTQTVLDRMQVQVAWQASTDGNYMRVHEAYVDLETNNQPTVVAPTVLGATTTTRPTVSVSYADTEGDPQVRYQSRVFSAAQYGVAGFTVDGSPNTWDSGQLYGEADTLTVGTDLINGTTYRAYVRAAQEWAGPEGDLWWSAWSAATTFTITVTPPPTPTVTAALDATLPGYRVLLTAAAPVNLATVNQASLETDTAGWAALANCSISRSTAWAADGSGSLQMSSTAAGTMTSEWSTRPFIAAGASYSATGTVRSAVSARTVRVGIRYWDQAGALLSTTYGTGATSATGADTTVTATVTAPATGLTVSVVVEVQSTGAAAEVHRWDKVGVQAGTTPSWSTGGSQGTARVLLERLLKVSALRAAPGNWVNPQLSSGGGVTRGTDGFYARQSSLLRSAPADLPPPGGIVNSGARMIVWHPLVGAFNGLDVGLNTAVTDDPAPPYLMPAVPGRAQTLSAYLKGSSAVNARIFVTPVDATNTQVGSGTEVSSATVALSTTAWGRYTATITAPAGTVYLRGLVELPSGSADLDVNVTGIQVELGSAATAPVPGTGAAFPVWETVRELDSTIPVNPGERYVAYDHEAPPGDPVLYRARTVAGTLASAPSAPVAVLLDPPARNLLKDPFQPENALIVNVDPRWSESQPVEEQLFRPLGRDAESIGVADPVLVRSWLGNQDGAYTLSVLSEVELWRLRQLIVSGRPLLLQHAEGGQRYALFVEDRSTERVTAGVYRIGVKTVGCARPI